MGLNNRFRLKINFKICILTIILIILILNLISKNNDFSYKIEDITSFKICSENIISLYVYSKKYKLDFVEILTYYTLENKFFQEKDEVDKNLISFIKKYKLLKRKYKNTNYLTYYNYFKNILTEIKNFPVLIDEKYYYIDSWGAKRTYGGNRLHLGTDIMSKENTKETIKIFSMTNGVIENLGWNEKGGYRVGIRSENGNYYYYAHLSSFSEDLKIGKNIESGTFLGYMGDTGYSKIEGTTGNFPVHLHIGIEVNTIFSSAPIWINPYPFLCLIEYLELE